MSTRLLDRTASIIATLGPFGHLPKIPGTWGSLAAIAAAPWLFMPLSFSMRVMVLMLILLVGTWAASRSERIFGRKDPGCVVVDELLGQWLTLLPFAVLSPVQLAAGFVFFRIFDILKPWPIRYVDRNVPGGFGVMVDDCIAAIPAAAMLWLMILFL
ncbi:phosphatidylglycerophosphatase A [Desulfonatronum thiosulfatophilum]|uniref:Phosphatidylglycerophosphatase A n=1 Tax=Desulfonatronum thiosulfatophilum TaxID=617002 RepID=A0A1G6A9Z4_9BACT|nr:phosphatidylglycerophosphatase A [Desulfonatronum thiosulfatophilum]SDB05257.1 phosphatidylglycerophosphatase A [Desulfonatronum thiosulfatophilum]